MLFAFDHGNAGIDAFDFSQELFLYNRLAVVCDEAEPLRMMHVLRPIFDPGRTRRPGVLNNEAQLMWLNRVRKANVRRRLSLLGVIV